MHDISLRQLEYFVAVVEERSVTEAAHRLRVSPGGISLALTQLESTLDIQLTLRVRGRGVSLTPAGRWVYREAVTLLEQTARISTAAQSLRGDLVGSLRLGCFVTLSPWLFPRIAAYFSETHPGVDLQLIEGISGDLQQQLKNGEIDAALLYENHLKPGIASTEILPVRLQIALSPTHRLAKEEEVALHDLGGEEAILLDVQPAISHVEDLMSRAGLRPNVKWRSTNVETIRSMVARGLGYSIIMGRPHSDFTYDGLPITYRKIADDIPRNAVVIAVPEGLELTEKISTLIAFCKKEFAAESTLSGDTGSE